MFNKPLYCLISAFIFGQLVGAAVILNRLKSTGKTDANEPKDKLKSLAESLTELERLNDERSSKTLNSFADSPDSLSVDIVESINDVLLQNTTQFLQNTLNITEFNDASLPIDLVPVNTSRPLNDSLFFNSTYRRIDSDSELGFNVPLVIFAVTCFVLILWCACGCPTDGESSYDYYNRYSYYNRYNHPSCYNRSSSSFRGAGNTSSSYVSTGIATTSFR